MKRTTTREVGYYWADGEAAANNGAQFWTDGQKLYSYRLCIGDTASNGKKVLKDYTSNGKHGFQSMTTSKHIGYARVHADIID
ncbi:MAG: hypothetical protein CBD26_03950 [Candidatus Pelagibacter sp. TMED166]|nr:MAG: hypothetical protein CBD26_03950 [Candidatus Pelagibacter sp. TMED166]|tara:strand:+ start:3631 stop:3879 length:249 start_codon:yes stop_codon:yes gene_type:complete